ncbi:lactonase family protein [Humitalea sp. 24SJ18S-53]|uniref:lactonase family protein n=1 Tax=Humitalea sp. 24SJ18S-53 TaxID=3422307 RepID=UPI003D66FF23
MTTGTIIAYVSCAGSREIRSFRLDPGSGTLTPHGTTAVPGEGGPSPSNMPLARNAGGTMLYAAVRCEPFTVSTFAIDRNSGALTAIAIAPLPAPLAYLSVAAGGRLLLGASYMHDKLTVSDVGPDGACTTAPRQVIPTEPKAHCIIPGRDGRTIYATTVDGNAILVFRLDPASMILLPADPPAIDCQPGAGPRHLAQHPVLDVLYGINETGGTIAAFAADRDTGALRTLQYESLMPPGFTGNARAADLHLTPDGRFAFASVRSTNVIGGFRLDPQSGRMTALGTLEVVGSPRGFAIAAQGRFLLCASQAENVVAVYAIDQDTGALTLRGKVDAPADPSWIEVVTLG